VIYDYYGGQDRLTRFDRSGLMAAVDAYDSADLTVADILEPTGWILLASVVDPRSSLERPGDFRIEAHQFMRALIGYCRTMNVDDILAVADVGERVERYRRQQRDYMHMLHRCSRADGNVIVIDLRGVDEMLSGSRFLEYALHPYQNVSVRCCQGKDRQNVVFSVGHSIVNRTCRVDIGRLMLSYGGGGHRRVGSCQVGPGDADRVLAEILEKLQAPA
jgi:nanoRNase/pAp phosphatase (c-di-AMP/oligoRNAs hydrolase)